MEPVENPQTTYKTLEEIRLRKDQLQQQLDVDSKQISSLWNSLFIKREESSKGEYIASLVTNSVTIIDLFFLYRKLRNKYGSIASLFGKVKKKK